MPLVTKLDALELNDLALPYNRALGELVDSPRLICGNNVYVTSGGKLARRPGTLNVATESVIAKKCKRLVAVETLETPPYVYLLGSFYNTADSVWEVYWIRLDAATPAWTKLTDLRDINKSTVPHEFLVQRGKVYIKGFPIATDDKLCSVIFDGTGGTVGVRFWGLLGPTTPARVDNPATWSSQVVDHDYQVLYGWKYTYAWETNTGHISCRAPLETNPDKNPSDTGPYVGLAGVGYCPQVVVQGHADTTRVPYINIYRSTDGGGTFYFLYQIANTGAAPINFVDKYLGSGVSGTTYKDPLPDAALDTAQIAPSEVSNLPPPTVIPPKVVGVDGVQKSTPIAVYAGRLWFAIGNYLYYSAAEEVSEGVPEESFVGGIRGNYFKLPYQITNVAASSDALFVFTLQNTYRVVGSDKETFNPKPFLNNVGHPYGHPRAVCSIGDTVAWLTHDFRIATVTDASMVVLSDSLLDDLTTAVLAGGEIQLTHWAELDKDYLVVSSHREDDTSYSRQWVCDLKRTAQSRAGAFWFPPWTMRATTFLSSRIKENTPNRRLVASVWDATNSQLVYMDSTGVTGTDYMPTVGATNYDLGFDTYLMSNPAGNHINALSKPARVPSVHYMLIDRSTFVGDAEPQAYFFLDDFWTTPRDFSTIEDIPPRREQGRSYKTIQYNVNDVGRHVALRMQLLNSPYRFELHAISVVFEPGGGT